MNEENIIEIADKLMTKNSSPQAANVGSFPVIIL